MQSHAAESAAHCRDNQIRLRVVEVVGNNFPWSNSKAFSKALFAEALTEPPDAVETLVSVNRCPIIRN
jgi:hypothetical protein